MLPETVFGVFGALSGPLMTTNGQPDFMRIVLNIPKVLLWTWLNTFVFVLANQRLPESILEDKLNKPFRPLAAGRLTSLQTRRLLFVSIPLVLAFVFTYLGSHEETILLFCLTWMYNDLGGSDEDFITRNLIIGLAYVLYGSGALRVAARTDVTTCSMSTTGFMWTGMIGGVIFTTMHVQDLKDQEGDRARNRHTAPLVLGERASRWTIAIPIMIWSVYCPIFWRLVSIFSVAPLILGFIVAVRVVRLRGRDADRTTWKLWSYWLGILYAFPLVKSYVP